MPDFTTLRYNENLVGRLVIAKLTGADDLLNYKNKAEVQSTVYPDQTFESYREWLATIKEDARLMQRIKEQQEETRKIMDNNIQYHESWINAKFKQRL